MVAQGFRVQRFWVQSKSACHPLGRSERFDSETNPEFIRFLRYAKRSCTEVQSELYVALDQKYITNAEFKDLYDHAGRTRAAIRGFIKYLLAYEENRRKKDNPEP